jgi:hypothetical protein
MCGALDSLGIEKIVKEKLQNVNCGDLGRMVAISTRSRRARCEHQCAATWRPNLHCPILAPPRGFEPLASP